MTEARTRRPLWYALPISSEVPRRPHCCLARDAAGRALEATFVRTVCVTILRGLSRIRAQPAGGCLRRRLPCRMRKRFCATHGRFLRGSCCRPQRFASVAGGLEQLASPPGDEQVHQAATVFRGERSSWRRRQVKRDAVVMTVVAEQHAEIRLQRAIHMQRRPALRTAGHHEFIEAAAKAVAQFE